MWFKYLMVSFGKILSDTSSLCILYPWFFKLFVFWVMVQIKITVCLQIVA